jgi:tRNA-dihydrouridine synthase 3
VAGYDGWMSLRDTLTGAVVMAPMTKGSNLPYRRLCVELGARVTISEMTVARRLKQHRKAEFALIRRFDGEPFFGVQLAGTNPEEMAWAAALVESRGADLVDLNCGCPIDHFTHNGIGAALGRQPQRIRRIVEAMKKAVGKIPVTVKLRLGWNNEMRNVIEQAQAAVDGGADALFVHGRTRNARYRFAADWEAIGSVVAAVPVPVVGNGDILFPADVERALARSGAAGVMSARGVLIKPWLFREMHNGYRDLSADERLSIYRRYVALAREHWAPMHTASSASGSSRAGTSTSGIAMRRATSTVRSRTSRSARANAASTRRSTRFSRAPTRRRTTTSRIA